MEKDSIILNLEKEKEKTQEDLSALIKDLLPDYEIDFNNLNQLLNVLNRQIDDFKIGKSNFLGLHKAINLINKIQGLERGIKKNLHLPPKVGDNLYDSILDQLRITYYDFFKTNPSIQSSKSVDQYLFVDPTLWISTDKTYEIKGPFSFTLLFAGGKITVKFPINVELDEIRREFLRKLFAAYDSKIDFILNSFKHYYISCVGRYFAKENYGYLGFISRLCDNMPWNIIYIDPSLKDGVTKETLDEVDFYYILPCAITFANSYKITTDELKRQNNIFANSIINQGETIKPSNF